MMHEVYEPSEDTFLLLDAIPHFSGKHVLEMGCGSGVIAVELALRGNMVTAVDINPEAVEATLRLAAEKGVEICAVTGNLFSAVSGLYDIIVFNPPYLPCPPEEDPAVCGGERDEVIRAFLKEAGEHLSPGGRIYLLLSSLNDVDCLRNSYPYRWKILAERRMAFHTLFVYELSRWSHMGSKRYI